MKKIILIPKPRRIEVDNFPTDLDTYMVQRKANGLGCIGRKQDGKIVLHSHRISSVTGDHIPYNDKIPHIVEEFEKRNPPDDTLWYMELILDTSYGSHLHRWPHKHELYQEDFNKVSGIIQTDKRHLEYAHVEALILEVFRIGGRDVTKKPNEWRYQNIQAFLKEKLEDGYIAMPENYSFLTSKHMFNKLIGNRWEGVVLKKKAGLISYKEYDKLTTTSVPRYDSQWKLVLRHTTEVIITGYRLSRKDPTKIASFEMCWYHKGKLVSIGHCAGLDENWRRMPRSKPQLPFVAEVRYKEITPEGKLLNAIFLGKIHYKNIWECVSEEDKK